MSRTTLGKQYDDDIAYWFTAGGRRIPVKKGQSKQDAFKGAFSKIIEKNKKAKLDKEKLGKDESPKELSPKGGQYKTAGGSKVIRSGDDYVVTDKLGTTKGQFKSLEEADKFAKGLDNKGNDLGKNESSKVVDDFWSLKSKVLNEKQFNKKVELNQKLNKFIKDNNLKFESDGLESKLYQGDKQISYLASDNLANGIKNKKYLYESDLGKNEMPKASKEKPTLDISDNVEIGEGIKGKDLKDNVEKIRNRVSNNYKPFEFEDVNMDKVKARSGLNDKEAKECVDLCKKIMDEAKAKEPQITKDVVDIAKANGAVMDGLDFRMKQVTSMAGKIGADAQDENKPFASIADGIKDSVRYTAVFEDNDLVNGYKNIKSQMEKKGYKEFRCKNFWDMYKNGTSVQKSIQCVFEDKDGFKFEYQFHTFDSEGIKELNHPLYEQQRAKTTSPERAESLNKVMKKLGSYVKDPEGVYDIETYSRK